MFGGSGSVQTSPYWLLGNIMPCCAVVRPYVLYVFEARATVTGRVLLTFPSWKKILFLLCTDSLAWLRSCLQRLAVVTQPMIHQLKNDFHPSII